jgi:hypothetical protein
MCSAGQLLACYARLARRQAHLLDPLLGGKPPVQWVHYPEDDAIDARNGYQWFYHSHSPADRAASGEHGHVHLFARSDGSGARFETGEEREFLAPLGGTPTAAATRHLISIGMSPVGVPISLFTVNRWVTGDQLLSSPRTVALLHCLKLATGHPEIDLMLSALLRLYAADVVQLIRQRDNRLAERAGAGPGTLDDVSLEVLSELSLNVDERIASSLCT